MISGYTPGGVAIAGVEETADLFTEYDEDCTNNERTGVESVLVRGPGLDVVVRRSSGGPLITPGQWCPTAETSR